MAIIKTAEFEFGFEFNPKMNPQEFIDINICFYTNKKNENHLQKDSEIDWSNVADLMTKLYRENLFNNY
jgi:hypothetical protein